MSSFARLAVLLAILLRALPGLGVDLPSALAEVSGLAVTPDGRLFAHDDELATLYEVDPLTGAVRKSFSLGVGKKKVQRGDFEGLAIAGKRFFLITSDGLLHVFAEGPDGGRVPFTVKDTGLGERCEIEGLATGPGETLVAACKNPRTKKLKHVLALFRLSYGGDVLGSILIPLEKVGGSFRASGIDRDPKTGTYLVVASHDRAIAEIADDGTVLEVRQLPPGHRQAEGVAVLPDGTIVVSDEGRGGAGTLTRHTRAELFPGPSRP